MGLLDKFKNKKIESNKIKETKETKEKESIVEIEKKEEKITEEIDNLEQEKEQKIKKAKNTKEAGKKVKNIRVDKILLRPLISEKAAIAEAEGKYTFIVAKNVNKVDIKLAVKQAYGVEPKTVRLMNVEGKSKRYGRSRGKRSDWKKAVIALPKGKSISIHEGV